MTNLTVTKLNFNEVSGMESAVSATSGATVPYSGCDDSRMLLIFENSGDATEVKVLAGDSIQGMSDLVLTVESGMSAITVESGKYMKTTGEDAGNITVTGSVNVYAVLLP